MALTGRQLTPWSPVVPACGLYPPRTPLWVGGPEISRSAQHAWWGHPVPSRRMSSASALGLWGLADSIGREGPLRVLRTV